MERLSVLLIALAGCLSVTATEFNCNRVPGTVEFPKQVCYVEKCTDAIMKHIKVEFNAAFKYMYMGSYFAQDTVDRPGLAKFLFEAASEERGHAIQMLDYLNLRGIKLDPTKNDNALKYKFNEAVMTNIDYAGALKEAVNMEIEVTDLIYKVVEACSEDFHGADVFTNPILDEQHDGLRKLEGAVRSFNDLKKGVDGQGLAFAEYVFDRKMMSGEF